MTARRSARFCGIRSEARGLRARFVEGIGLRISLAIAGGRSLRGWQADVRRLRGWKGKFRPQAVISQLRPGDRGHEGVPVFETGSQDLLTSRLGGAGEEDQVGAIGSFPEDGQWYNFCN